LKFLIFNWRCWLNPAAGGAEIFTREVARYWAREGHEVTLFTSEFQGCKNEEMSDGVRIIRCGGKYSVYGKAKEYYRKYFSHENYDVVIDEINTKPFFAPKFVNNNELVVALIHQLAREYWFYETSFPVNYFGYYFFENRWLKNYIDTPTVTVSESTKQDLASLGFKQIFEVPEGLNFKPLDTVTKKEEHPVIVYAGRLKRAKRPDHAVKAFELVKKMIPEAELWIFGEGPLKSELKHMSNGGVRFLGNLPNEERRKMVERAWVLINPSVREGWGLNIIEANALGTPCVAYDVNGLRDSVKNNETGLLVKSGCVEDLADAIVRVIKHNSLRNQLSRKSLEYSRQFSWDKTADIFLNTILQVMNT
jgi:glycosyltransferase involved in cell wall biosynthesis